MPKLLAEERRRKILEMVEKDGRVTVDLLVKRFGVSAVTVRADLDALGESGAVVRAHGGAVRRLDPEEDYPLQFKQGIHHSEKVRIAHAASQLVKPGQTILLDSGTTTTEIARLFKMQKNRPLTVITNAVNIATELSGISHLSLVVIGGIMRPTSASLVGPQAESMLRQLHADHLFLGVDGLDPEIGASTPDILEAQLNTLMMDVSSETTVVADASKLGRRSLSLIGKLEGIQRLITDSRIEPAMIAAFHNRGVEVVVV